jgi:hypothetical protein
MSLLYNTAQVREIDFSHLFVRATAKDFNKSVVVGTQTFHGFVHFTSQEIGRRQTQGHHNPFEIATQFTFQFRLEILFNYMGIILYTDENIIKDLFHNLPFRIQICKPE